MSDVAAQRVAEPMRAAEPDFAMVALILVAGASEEGGGGNFGGRRASSSRRRTMFSRMLGSAGIITTIASTTKIIIAIIRISLLVEMNNFFSRATRLYDFTGGFGKGTIIRDHAGKRAVEWIGHIAVIHSKGHRFGPCRFLWRGNAEGGGGAGIETGSEQRTIFGGTRPAFTCYPSRPFAPCFQQRCFLKRSRRSPARAVSRGNRENLRSVQEAQCGNFVHQVRDPDVARWPPRRH